VENDFEPIGKTLRELLDTVNFDDLVPFILSEFTSWAFDEEISLLIPGEMTDSK